MNFQIRLQPTSSTTSTAWIDAGWTLCYSIANLGRPTAGSWVTHTFSTPFTWDGTNNLLIDISRDDIAYTTGGGMYCRTGLTNRMYSGHADNGSWPFTGLTSAIRSFVPEIKITGKKYVSSGTIASYVKDIGQLASWLKLEWVETLPSKSSGPSKASGDITFEVRASNTAFAAGDITPSWISVGGTSPITTGLPAGRYQQWRATLTTPGPSPILHEVRAVSLPFAVELLDFSAIGREKFIELCWRTEAEINNTKWLIVRSEKEDTGYAQIAELPAKGSLSQYQYNDSSVALNTTYYYKLATIDINGRVTWHPSVSAKTKLVKYSLYLREPVPNPFKSEAKINYQIPGYSGDSPRPVTLKIYDLSGRIIRILVDNPQNPGPYTISWDGRDEDENRVSTGVYFYRLKVADKLLTRKLIRLK